MRRLRALSVCLLFAGSFIASSCGGGGDDPQPTEEDLVITTSPPINGQVEASAPGPNFPLAVTVTSAMPPQGVKIDVSARPDGGNTPFFTTTQNTSNRTTNFSITNTPQLITCRVTVTVTSLSKPSNTVTGHYLYSRK